MNENEAVAALLPVELLIDLDIWIESLDKPLSRADAVRAFVKAGLELMAENTDPVQAQR